MPVMAKVSMPSDEAARSLCRRSKLTRKRIKKIQVSNAYCEIGPECAECQAIHSFGNND